MSVDILLLGSGPLEARMLDAGLRRSQIVSALIQLRWQNYVRGLRASPCVKTLHVTVQNSFLLWSRNRLGTC